MIHWKFLELCEEKGWDAAIDYLKHNMLGVSETIKDSIYALIDMYDLAYNTSDFRSNGDPDSDLCYKMRSFAIQEIISLLED